MKSKLGTVAALFLHVGSASANELTFTAVIQEAGQPIPEKTAHERYLEAKNTLARRREELALRRRRDRRAPTAQTVVMMRERRRAAIDMTFSRHFGSKRKSNERFVDPDTLAVAIPAASS